MADKKKHLPMYGVGPVYGAVIIAVTVAAVTAGVYSLVRNPIYSAFLFFCTGALFISGNIFFYPLFFFYWLFMVVLMKCTEEKWLKNLYGREYEEYCRRVNRCIPWFPKS